MPICPNGHNSADEEYCEVCGRAMGGSPSPPPAPSVTREPDPVSSQGATVCPACGTPLDGRFCESCGHDSLAAPPPAAVAPPTPAAPPPAPTAPSPPATAPPSAAAGSWTATVSADRAYYESVIAIGGPDAASITFPAYCPDRYFPLRANQVSIGRRSTSRGIHPDIDLTGPPEDPGVSHLHAVLVVGPNGDLSIVDLGSSNGTTVNDSSTSLRANTPHPLSTGDRIHLGAWTTITVRAD
jgi:hypothetical protein